MISGSEYDTILTCLNNLVNSDFNDIKDFYQAASKIKINEASYVPIEFTGELGERIEKNIFDENTKLMIKKTLNE